MLTNLHQLLGGRPPEEPEEPVFVERVRREIPPEPRSRRAEWVLTAGWALIVVKCVAVGWVIRAYEVPVHPGWVIFPTLGAAAVCTWLYWRR